MIKIPKPPSDDAEEGSYTVGYGKPPKASQFKKGQSGNPAGSKGRKKDKRGIHGSASEILGRMITVRENGVTRKMPYGEALLHDWAAKALNGSARDKMLFMNYMNEHFPEAIAPMPSPLNVRMNFVKVEDGEYVSRRDWLKQLAEEEAERKRRGEPPASNVYDLAQHCSHSVEEKEFWREKAEAEKETETAVGQAPEDPLRHPLPREGL